ncbi:dihydrofolate reductase family protein [Cytobacillus purgationiresistens]|uniref:Dihydrofolate reductase n=1 Tax=Cytobacillus purgationiresistens TaxID=863449 RepID=A0ABU0AJC1_9BACI|nr:dihydrofolate reductase family protein [Cytobacillus purgationiresistens]MDQ0271364.1 dihydrofolate reductase [Cytobacillus purgationiresistens]
MNDDLKAEISRLKEQAGKDMDLGGSEIASAFIELDLINEYRLYIHPILLGEGKQMFQANKLMNMEHIESRRFSSGVVLLRYGRKKSKEN